MCNNCCDICDWACKIDHLSTKKLLISFVLLYHTVSLILYNYLHYQSKIFITIIEFNGLSSAAYGNGILYSE